MALTKNEFRSLVELGDLRVLVVGVQGGAFHLVCDGHGTLADDRGAIVFPSLNHAADFLQRSGIDEFHVDVRLWRDSKYRSDAKCRQAVSRG